jgi:hypothetical protein
MLDLAYIRADDTDATKWTVAGVASARDSVLERCCRP